MTVPPLAIVSVTDALVDALRTQILDGQWAPGTPVAEVQVARTFRVSRPTARTAVRALVNDGLLRQDAHHAPYVPELSNADLADLFLIRVPVEIAIVERLCDRPNSSHLTAAGENIDRLESLTADATTSDFVTADLGFHRALAAATDSPRLQRTFTALAGEIHLSMIQTRKALGRDRIVREHRQILRAVTRADPDAAASSVRRHLAGALKALSQDASV
jgi:DNA-binding GntR family transcriptional regulator